MNTVGQCSSLVAHCLSVPGDHSLNLRGGEKFSSFVFRHDLMRLDSNIESKSSNNNYLNIIEILFLL